MKNLTASDRSALIKLAASLPKGDANRRAILGGLAEIKTASADDAILRIIKERSKRKQGTTPSQLHYLHNIPLRDAVAAIDSLERKGLITPDLDKPASSRQAPEVEFFAKTAAETPESVNALMATLGRLPGVASVYITDTWSDGYFHLRVVLDPKESKNELGGWSGKVIDLEYARGRYGKFFNIPDFVKVVAAIRALTKRSGLLIESVEGPKKVYEFQDQRAKARREPRLSGYDGKEISIELYAR